jgi:uncharacterized cysteine cluster protein YcgN (CxxCxxCC family)
MDRRVKSGHDVAGCFIKDLAGEMVQNVRAMAAADEIRPTQGRIMPKDTGSAPSQKGKFWKTKTLEEMSDAEWESLCDGCGRCCLEKLEDEDTGRIYYTHVACRLFDAGRCACSDYANRSQKVADCVRLTPDNVRTLKWLPPSCAYRLVAEGRDLYWWHPLVSGDPETVHTAGVSVRGRVVGTEAEVPLEELEHHIVRWPRLLPKRARRPGRG